MFVYKKLKASDIAVVPFNAHKQYDHNLKGYSDSINHLYFITCSWSQSSIDQYEAANIGHSQLEHLFYEDYPSNLANKFGNVNFIKHHRQLDEEVYIYSIPQLNYGVEIKPKSLQLETITHVENFYDETELLAGNTIELTARFIDDGLGNIFHLETSEGSGSSVFTPEFFPNSQKYNYKEVFKDDRIFYLNPINSYKYLDLSHERVGKGNKYSPTGGGNYKTDLIKNLYTHSIGPNSSLPHFDSTNCVIPTYSQEDVYDDSYYYGLVDYNNIRFSKYSYFPKYRGFDEDGGITEDTYDTHTDATKITFMDFHHNGLGYHTINKKKRNIDKRGGSYLQLPHNEKYNFNTNDDFAINFNLKPVPYLKDVLEDRMEFHIIGKSLTKIVVASALEGKASILNLNTSGSSQEVDVPSALRYPFEIFLTNGDYSDQFTYDLHFRRSDGNKTHTVIVSGLLATNQSIYNITCQYRKDDKEDLILEIWVDGVKQGSVLEDYPVGCTTCGKDAGITQNNANIYIGCQGGIQNFFTGSLQNISIYQRALKEEEILEHKYESKYIGTPIVGNIFYSMGLITITNPYYFNHFKHKNITSSIRYKNTMPLTENEIQCTIDEQEYNYTNNVTTRCIQNEEGESLANFATGSLWKPYVTTLGLYNENHELLVVGKLGQPTKMSDETDTTFVLRWDT